MSGFVKVHVKALHDQGQELMPLLQPHISRAAETIKNYMVTLIVNEEPLGSGTFVKTCGVEGILTAYHVAEKLFQFSEFSLCVADFPHRLDIIPPGIVEHIPIGAVSKTSSADEGPDLSFLIIKDAGLLEKLRTLKSFYLLDSVRLPSLHPCLNPRIWGIAGTNSDSFKRIKENHNGAPLSKMTNFVGTGFFSCESFEKEFFDYVKLEVTAGKDRFPDNYRGMSGGGFWLIPLEANAISKGDTNADLNTIGHRPPILAGVEFFQSERENGNRILTGHGPHSVYLRLREVLNSLPRKSNIP